MRLTLLIVLLSCKLVYSQNFTSTIRGSVRDADNRRPLTQASVLLVNLDKGTTTDDAGTFRFEALLPGRYQLRVSYVGYETSQIQEILLESGKERVEEVFLAPAGQELQEAVVKGTSQAAYSSVQAITIEQTLRYAATYMDPARVATSFPGVAAANDQANGLVVRGNSPNSMQWRLEGVEIVNPNHLSNAGTFSDRPTSTGGGVNILSTQLLGTTNFLSGAFPGRYGNVNGGIMDMGLRKGNDEKTEFTAQASLIGMDLAAEGPFSKNSKASYLINYRYSFTGLLGLMGVNFGGEDSRFQDLALNLNLPAGKAGNFTVFAMGGLSRNDFAGNTDSTAWEIVKDGYNIKYKNKMGAAGVTHQIPLGRSTSLRTVVAYSGLNTSRVGLPIYNSPMTRPMPENNGELTRELLSLTSAVNWRLSRKHLLAAGAYVTFRHDAMCDLSRDFNTQIWQPYITWNWRIAPGLTADLGVHSVFSAIQRPDAAKHQSVEPRASLQWQASGNDQFSFSYGLHSQMQVPQLYGATYSTTMFDGNWKLAPTKSHQFVVGYRRELTTNSSLKLEAYWQEFFAVPIQERARFSALNFMDEALFLPLTNDGKGRNYGLEATYQKLLTNQFYLLVSGSIYDATYTLGNDVHLKSRYSGRHTFSFTGGKEIKTKSGAIWGFNAKILWLGGFRDRPVDASQSADYNTTIYATNDYTVQLRDYFRPDLRIYWKKSHAKYSRTLALDLQNVSGTRNQAYQYYDTVQKRVTAQNQLGLIPVISYRWEF